MTILLHPDRYSTSGVQTRKLGCVIHTNEGPDGSGASLLRYLQSPGDRPLSDGRKYGSGYHAIAQPDGTWLDIADETCGPFHAPPLNKTWWSICIPGFAAQTLDQWLDPMSRAYIRAVAAYVVDRSKRDGFPLVRPTVVELRNGASGYCAHWDVSLAWKQTNHTDPGPNFPWEVLAADIAELTRPPQPIVEDEMYRYIRVRGDLAIYKVSGVYALWVSDGDAVRDELIGAAGGAVHEVERYQLKAYQLIGAGPWGIEGVTTSHTDFNSWRP